MDSDVLKAPASFLLLAVVALCTQDSPAGGSDHFLLWKENPVIEPALTPG